MNYTKMGLMERDPVWGQWSPAVGEASAWASLLPAHCAGALAVVDQLGAYGHVGITGFPGEVVKGSRKAMGSPSKREGQGGFCYQCCRLRGLVKILQRPGCGLLSVPEPGNRRMGALRRAHKQHSAQNVSLWVFEFLPLRKGHENICKNQKQLFQNSGN